MYHENVRIVMFIDDAMFNVYNLEENTVRINRFYDDVSPRIINNMIFLPVRSLAAASGIFHMEWDGKHRIYLHVHIKWK